MTAKRDLKRRVRHRQVRTGEAYVTARRHVLAARPATQAEAEAEPRAATDAEHEIDGDETDAGLDEVTAAGAQPPSRSGAAANETRAAAVPTESADDADTGPIAQSFAVSRRSSESFAPGDTTDRTAAGWSSAGADAAEIGSAAAAPGAGSASPGSSRSGDPREARLAASGGAVPVIELVDVSEEACRCNILCRVSMFPSLLARVDAAVVLTQLRDLLIATAEDPQMAVFSQLALTGRGPKSPPRLITPTNFDAVRRFLRHARAGLGGVSDDGLTLAFPVAGPGGLIPIQCSLHWPLRMEQAAAPSFVLLGIDDMMVDTEALREQLLIERAGSARASDASGASARATAIADMIALRRPPPRPDVPTLFVIVDGRRHAIARDEFLIGRAGATVHLAIRDGMVSRRHAAVIRRDGKYYLRDLGSANGITYKGMQIDNKRIDEGDAFQIGDHVLAFTFRDDE
jgi:hypothetical protein